MRHSTLGSRPKDSAPASQLLPLLRGRSRRLHATRACPSPYRSPAQTVAHPPGRRSTRRAGLLSAPHRAPCRAHPA